MLVKCENKPRVLHVNVAQYRGWIFYDNMEIPRWVWVLKGEPKVKPDIYPSYDSSWREVGPKTMDDKDTGYLVRPMVDEGMVRDEQQRKKTMAELNKVGQQTEIAFLENLNARHRAGKEGKEEEGEEQLQGEHMELGQVERVRPGGVIAVDNVLWFGRVVDPTVEDKQTVAIRHFNEHVRTDSRLTASDGITLLMKRRQEE
ncbi:hypothetical protein CBR_g4504 [Chara braunii]|uniref:Uncharacterized protein n=1 Tax=Chara braunii TaxID=69332 RepID=A0A388KI84_CHABU|nr:hypothetical protein CBR_g4504 [Chara braunii]|eukprot:GBG69673.1 hypothetical protein CBR_g4504 [Chara braunii]